MKRIMMIAILIISFLVSTNANIPAIAAGDNYVKIQQGFTLDPSQPGERIERGSVIHHLSNGITEVYKADKSLKLRTRENESQSVRTTKGSLKANRIYHVPNGSKAEHKGNTTRIFDNDTCILTIIDEKYNQKTQTAGTPNNDDWIRSVYTGSQHLSSLSIFDASLTVPTAPPNPTTTNNALFTGIQPPNGLSLIQPVLRYDPSQQTWSICSEDNFFPDGDIQSSPQQVSSGDPIRSNMTYSNGFWSINIWMDGGKSSKYGGAFSGSLLESNIISDVSNSPNTQIDAVCILEAFDLGSKIFTGGINDLAGSCYFKNLTFVDGDGTVISPTWSLYPNGNPTNRVSQNDLYMVYNDSKEVDIKANHLAANTINATNITSSSATLNGFLDGPFNLAPPNTVSIYFDWANDSYWTVNPARYNLNNNLSPITLSTNTSFNLPITGLSPGILYHFRARAVFSGTTYYGSDQTFSTADTGGINSMLPFITTDYPYNITTTGATVYGTLGNLFNASNVSLSFEFTSDSNLNNPSSISGSPSPTNNAGIFSASLPSLSVDTTYYFRTKATGNGGNNYSYGGYQTFRTRGTQGDDTKPIVITGGVDSITKTSANLDGILTSFGPGNNSATLSFYFDTKDQYVANNGFKFTSPATSTQIYYNGNPKSTLGAFTVPVSNLKEKEHYAYQAVATSNGQTALGDVVFFETLDPVFESYHASGGNTNLTGGYYMAQTFTPQISHTINHFTIDLNNNSATSGIITGSLRATSNGQPIGSDLIVSMPVSEQTIPNTWTPTNFFFVSNYALTAGTTYALVIHPQASGLSAMLNTNNGYTRGQECASSDGTNWNMSNTTWDAWFEEDGYTTGTTSTTTSLTSSQNPSNSGQSVTFSANINQTWATGTVQFMDGPYTLGDPQPVASHQATYSTSSLAVGSHSITAIYNGDPTYAGSTSSVLSQTVNSGSSPTRHEYYPATSSTTNLTGGYYMAQIFTAQSSYSLTSFKMRIFNNNVSSGTIRGSLRNVSGGQPTSSDITYVDFNFTSSTLPTNTWTDVSFNFGGGQQLQQNGVYAIVIHPSVSGLSARIDTNVSSFYGSPGQECASSNGSSWNMSNTTWDAWFECWGQ